MLVNFTRISHNQKTGFIPVTTSCASTCPDNCSLKNNGCYASSGYFTNMHWNKVTQGARGDSHSKLCDDIRALPTGQLWRHNIAGDLVGSNNRINKKQLFELVEANKGRKGFTYTHKPLTRANVAMISEANLKGFTINISADNVTIADKIRADYPALPIAVILPIETTKNFISKGGNKIVICPAIIRDNVTCQSCELCQKVGREIIIGFPAHGAGKKKAITATQNRGE